MRSILHVRNTSSRAAAESCPPLPTVTNPRRRVVRAAWAICQQKGLQLAQALRESWKYSKRQSELPSVMELNGRRIREVCIAGVSNEIVSALPTEGCRFLDKSERELLSNVIERLIDVLDFADECYETEIDADFEVDTDFEPDHRDLDLMTEFHLPQVAEPGFAGRSDALISS